MGLRDVCSDAGEPDNVGSVVTCDIAEQTRIGILAAPASRPRSGTEVG